VTGPGQRQRSGDHRPAPGRWRGLLLLLVLVLTPLGPAPVAAAPSRKKTADAPYPAEFQSRVRKAIERGVEYLRTQQLRDRTPLTDRDDRERREEVEYEEAAGVTWVLRRAGVEADDAALARARKRLQQRPTKGTEEAGLLLLALCTQPLPEGNPFSIKAAAPGAPLPLSTEDRALVEKTVAAVLAHQVTTSPGGGFLGREYDSRGGWGAFSDRDATSDRADIPTTYMALLGLEAAARAGVDVPPSHHLAALELLLGWQADKGPPVGLLMNEVRGTDRFEWFEKAKARGFGWAGTMSDQPTGYETVGGALGLVICQDALQQEVGFTETLQKAAREGIRDALAWVQQNYDITKNPATSGKRLKVTGALYHHHWLQGLARLAIHSRMRFLGKHDWYKEGAEVLLKTQRSDGSWNAIWWDNCYSLLFLLRASLPSIVPVVTPSEQEPGK
jgi:hypothetical protein